MSLNEHNLQQPEWESFEVGSSVDPVILVRKTPSSAQGHWRQATALRISQKRSAQRLHGQHSASTLSLQDSSTSMSSSMSQKRSGLSLSLKRSEPKLNLTETVLTLKSILRLGKKKIASRLYRQKTSSKLSVKASSTILPLSCTTNKRRVMREAVTVVGPSTSFITETTRNMFMKDALTNALEKYASKRGQKKDNEADLMASSVASKQFHSMNLTEIYTAHKKKTVAVAKKSHRHYSMPPVKRSSIESISKSLLSVKGAYASSMSNIYGRSQSMIDSDYKTDEKDLFGVHEYSPLESTPGNITFASPQLSTEYRPYKLTHEHTSSNPRTPDMPGIYSEIGRPGTSDRSMSITKSEIPTFETGVERQVRFRDYVADSERFLLDRSEENGGLKRLTEADDAEQLAKPVDGGEIRTTPYVVPVAVTRRLLTLRDGEWEDPRTEATSVSGIDPRGLPSDRVPGRKPSFTQAARDEDSSEDVDRGCAQMNTFYSRSRHGLPDYPGKITHQRQ
ncbi:hypothetical protein ElyMa_005841800 [Elysia marginata]|uniref:Uncharacterized protein n=1 Tax=Elysia marginata TaxID=1093978 RepID=A0AAV4FXP4_9GAST|nr:hypothetical protein ElyMa_005841800 [Elysia marginata]